ncbi:MULTISPECIES: 3'-5' exonuclease [unclassified Rhodanobacter]|uniref:3'-5' exonuclease n=1 Tax=unclassified Rhodanobacter TaxID=2621553 RepID=UPI001BDE03AF|nr:3'-5' exonuclease [Rhodanobacter sp. LX-99]MBT2148192.1 3'-5' exonuclease [Rhodanobacter sp. LX-100]
MNILIFDTETSGLPDYKQPSEMPHQPHIVELAVLLYDDTTGELVEQLHSIVRPDGWVIPDDVAAIHGITTERAMDEGRPEHEVLRDLLALHRRAELRVAHNEDFDQRIVRIAIKRYGHGAHGWDRLTQEERDAIADAFKAAPKYCTMKADAKARGVKWPKLVEAYKYHTGKDLGEDAHSALFDALACAEVYFAMNPIAAVA